MKKIFIILYVFISLFLISGCKKENTVKSFVKVGMVTDSGTINDKSFNQGTWDGILQANAKLGIEAKYLKPNSISAEDYIESIEQLIKDGYSIIVCPGFKFETAIYSVQDKYPKVLFILLDGIPHNDDYSDTHISPNVASVSWKEQEAGFIAAVASAVQIKKGEFGFIGGMEIPAVQKYNWGWQQGIAYANSRLGTNITIHANNVVYQGSFSNVAAGQELAATIYDRGINVIFAAAGGVGEGVINEAKNRRYKGEDVWVVGVDVDQYDEGLLPNGTSAVLTSAMKYLSTASFTLIKAALHNEFPGGQAVTLDSSVDGLGIPFENPNLSAEAQKAAADAEADIKAGKITVADKISGAMIR